MHLQKNVEGLTPPPKNRVQLKLNDKKSDAASSEVLLLEQSNFNKCLTEFQWLPSRRKSQVEHLYSLTYLGLTERQTKECARDATKALSRL